MIRNDLRNIAIVAHVDHGQNHLLNEMLKQGGAFRENQVVEDRVMDSNALERERGITITSKNTAIEYNGVKINVIDTPGHADFGGEVERILKMVDGILLLVDAFEGPHAPDPVRPPEGAGAGPHASSSSSTRSTGRMRRLRTRSPTRCWNCSSIWTPPRNSWTAPVIYCSGREGIGLLAPPSRRAKDLQPLFDNHPRSISTAPQGDPDGPLQMLVSSIDYNDYVGRIRRRPHHPRHHPQPARRS